MSDDFIVEITEDQSIDIDVGLETTLEVGGILLSTQVLNQLQDVEINNLQENDLLLFKNTKWRNSPDLSDGYF